jgi:hypothetical protein
VSATFRASATTLLLLVLLQVLVVLEGQLAVDVVWRLEVRRVSFRLHLVLDISVLVVGECVLAKGALHVVLWRESLLVSSVRRFGYPDLLGDSILKFWE